MKRAISLLLTFAMLMSFMIIGAFAASGDPITGTITKDTVWNDGDVIGNVKIQGDVTITVNGTVTVVGTISMNTDSLHTATIKGGTENAKLIRGASFQGQMFYVEGNSYVFQNLTFKNLTLDGGAVWTGEKDPVLDRGTVNSGVKATGSVLYLVRANVTLDNCVLQNHDNGTNSKAAAVFLREYATIQFNESVARNNNNADGYYKGGVVTTRYGGIVIAKDSEVYGNSATHGGFVGVSSSGSYGVKVDCVNTNIHNNYAGAGAAFYLQDNGSKIYTTTGDRRPAHLNLDGCTLKNNASPDGLIYSYVYYTPSWLKNTTIENNDCAIYTNHNENKSFSVAGDTNITSDRSDCLYMNPVRIYGKLGSSASVPMNQATVEKLMAGYGYLVTAAPDIDHHYNHTSAYQNVVPPYEYTGEALYDITLADLEKVALYAGHGYTGWVLTDVDGNGMLDAVPVSVAATTVNVELIDTFKGGNDSQTQDVSNVVANVPVSHFQHTGYFFNGWLKEDGTLIKDVSNHVILEGGEKLTATWAVARPRVKISAETTDLKAGDSVKLTATITNKNSQYLEYSYQWYKNNTAIDGATKSTYTVTEEEAGYYSYQCKVTATDASYNSDTDYASKTTYGSAYYKEGIVLQFKAIPGDVCYIKETGDYYKTLFDAVGKANELPGANTIVMIADIDFDSNKALAVTGELTIVSEEGKNHVISRGAYTGIMFSVGKNNTLTLDGGLVIDGSNNWVMDTELYKEHLAQCYRHGISIYDPNYDRNTYINPYNTNLALQYFPGYENGTVATAYMITTNGGTVNLNKVTIQNNFSKNSGLVLCSAGGSTVNLEGVHVTHVASSEGNGVVVKAENKSTINIKAGTVIEGSHVGSNHGLFKIYSGAVANMSGGEIKNITGWNANGVAFGMWSSSEANRSTFNMTGGLITGCSSIYGPDNGRTAAVYLHNLSKMVMTGGTITGNSGMGCPGGIDSSRVNSILIIGRADQEFDNEAWEESYAAAYNPDNHPFVVDNSSYYESKTDLYQHAALVNWKLTGGIYTSDVTLYCAPGYVCIPYEDSQRTDDYIVVPGFRVDYYSASEESVTDPETGVESTIYNTQLVATRFHLLKQDQTLADLKAESITVQLDATSSISDWYVEAALENAYDFDTALMGNLSLYGGVDEVIEDGETPLDPTPNVPKTGDNDDLALAMFGALLSLAAIAVVLKNKKFFA